MAEDMPENEGGDHEFKPGPIGQMMDDFHAYTDAIRTAHEEPEKEAELLAKLKKKCDFCIASRIIYLALVLSSKST